MQRKIFSLFLLCLWVVNLVMAADARQLRRYLVAFSVQTEAGMPRFFMEIDQTGRILRSPKLITMPEGQGSPLVGVFQLPHQNPILWLRHHQSSLYALEVDARTWSVVSRRKTSMTAQDTIDIGYAGSLPLLVANNAENKVVGYPITRHGISTGQPVDLFPRTDAVARSGAISADGRARLVSTEGVNGAVPGLLLRTVNAAGSLTGADRVVAVRDSETFLLSPADVTNLLRGNNRLVAYVNTPASEFVSSTLWIRSVPLDRHAALGPEQIIGSSGPFSLSIVDVALDPSGSFVLYSTAKELRFQALGKDGSARDMPVQLLTSKENESLLQLDIVQE